MAKTRAKSKVKMPTTTEKVVNPSFKTQGAKGSLSGADITGSAQSLPKKVTKTT